ncbi:MAG: glycoside hydrolase family 88 protein [Pontiella sp.]
MKIRWGTHATLFWVGCLLLAPKVSMAAEERPSADSVKEITQRVAEWQIATFEDQHQYRSMASKMRAKIERAEADSSVRLSGYEKSFLKKWPDLGWHNGALYVGMNQWRKVSGDASQTAWLRAIGERNEWALYKRPYHADDHTVGQFYLSFAEEFNQPEMRAPTQERFDWILENPKTRSLEFCGYKKPYTTDCHYRWGWCDALFMAPPVWTRLAKLTGDRTYLEFMDQEYHATYDLLWDAEEHLFFRDTRYFTRFEENGKKLFWSRGNGWVFGGLALMIPDMPDDWEGRTFYVDLFQQIAKRLVELQRNDGTWSMGLLGGTEGYPIKETSGTAFFTFGLAWGINAGLLDRATYEPVIFSAWKALTECVTPDGMVGFVQPVGAAPGDSFADKTEVYGTGAFLAAGSEVYQLVGGERPALKK